MPGTKLQNLSTIDGVKELNKLIDDKNKHIFVLVFMEECGPCKATRPEWAKINADNKSDDVVIAEVNSRVLDDSIAVSTDDVPTKAKITHVESISGYPTIKHIHNGKAQSYNGVDRSADSFEKWIQDSVSLRKKQLSKKYGGGSRRSYSRIKKKANKRKTKRKNKKRRSNKRTNKK